MGEMKGLSLRPSDAIEGSAVAPDGNYRITGSKVELWDYNGKAPATVAIKLTMSGDDGSEFVQYYSAGDPTRLQPSEDGKRLVPTSEAVKGLNKSCNAFILLSNMVNAGFPENKIGDDMSVFEGTYAQFQQIPEPERKTLKRAVDENRRQSVIPVPVKILQLPWEKKGAAPKTAAKATGKATATKVEETTNDSIMEKAVDLAREQIAQKGSVTRKEIGVAVFKIKDPDRDKIARVVYGAEFLAACVGAGLAVDGETISAG